MADAVTFLVRLEEKIAGPARQAQEALRTLEDRIASETATLAKLEEKVVRAAARLRELSAVSVRTKAQDLEIGRLQKSLGRLQDKAHEQRQVLDVFRSKLGTFRDAAARARPPVTDIAGAVAQLPGPLGRAAGGLQGIGGALSSLGGAGAVGAVAALAAAFVALGAAIGVAVVKFAAWSFASADGKRSAILAFQAILGTREAAIALEESVGALADSGLVTEDRLMELAKSLAVAGLRGEELTRTLETLAAVEATVGGDAVDKLKGIIERSKAAGQFVLPVKGLVGTGVEITQVYEELARRTGQTVEQVKAALDAGKVSIGDGVAALNAVVGGTLGGLASEKALSFGAQLARAKKLLGDLADDTAIQPLLEAFSRLVSLLDTNTAAGQALKALVQAIATSLATSLVAAMPTIVSWIKTLVIWGLKLWIALNNPAVMASLKAAFFGLAVVLGVVVAAIAAVGAVFGAVLFALFRVVGGIVEIISFVIDQFASLPQVISDLIAMFGPLAKDFWNGFVNGIKAGGQAVVDAVLGVGRTAIESVKKLFGISSPSRVMMQLGGFTAEGFTLGVEAGAPAAHGAVARLAAPEVQAPAARSFAPTINATINIAGAGDPKTTAVEVRRELVLFLEDLATQGGA